MNLITLKNILSVPVVIEELDVTLDPNETISIAASGDLQKEAVEPKITDDSLLALDTDGVTTLTKEQSLELLKDWSILTSFTELRLTAPNDSVYRVTVDKAGAITTTLLS